MDTLFKQIVAYYVKCHGFGIVSGIDKTEALIFIDECLEMSMLIQNEGDKIVILSLGTRAMRKYSSFDAFVKSMPLFISKDDIDIISDVDDWVIPKYQEPVNFD